MLCRAEYRDGKENIKDNPYYMPRSCDGREIADELCMLVVINTASIQLIPTTAAALRAAAGSSAPFDILPAVWAVSALSLSAGLCAAFVLKKFWK